MVARRMVKASIDPSLLQPLGSLTANFNMLELVVKFFIGDLMRADPWIGQIVTAQLSFTILLDKFCSLYRHHVSNPDKLASLEDLRKRLVLAGERRNKFVHGFWAAGIAGGSTLGVTKAKAKTGLQFTYEPVTAAELSAASEEMAALAQEVMDLHTSTLEVLNAPYNI